MLARASSPLTHEVLIATLVVISLIIPLVRHPKSFALRQQLQITLGVLLARAIILFAIKMFAI
ncbi:MAG: hypothetical protein CMJ74_01335 [Planctomycetaceae bacterium]|nr:hypothetical protein [Planctomycetaceae bacterium]|tara:strand:- start:283 stop:471 length:189 start_codon:yes stop_codon:yes gene_type:complete